MKFIINVSSHICNYWQVVLYFTPVNIFLNLSSALTYSSLQSWPLTKAFPSCPSHDRTSQLKCLPHWSRGRNLMQLLGKESFCYSQLNHSTQHFHNKPFFRLQCVRTITSCSLVHSLARSKKFILLREESSFQFSVVKPNQTNFLPITLLSQSQTVVKPKPK